MSIVVNDSFRRCREALTIGRDANDGPFGNELSVYDNATVKNLARQMARSSWGQTKSLIDDRANIGQVRQLRACQTVSRCAAVRLSFAKGSFVSCKELTRVGRDLVDGREVLLELLHKLFHDSRIAQKVEHHRR